MRATPARPTANISQSLAYTEQEEDQAHLLLTTPRIISMMYSNSLQ